MIKHSAHFKFHRIMLDFVKADSKGMVPNGNWTEEGKHNTGRSK